MNSLATRVLALIVVLLATAKSWAEEPKANPADEKALHELHRTFLAAFNKGDAEALAALHTADVDFQSFTGQWSKGRPEFEKMTASFFAQHKGIQLNSPFGTVRFLTPDVAIADRPSGLTPAPEGASGPNKVHATVLYIKHGGKWQIAAVRLMAPFQPPRP
jgi:uncharacterized protein (TIGR02246 family)